jgi:hypothetical protein
VLLGSTLSFLVFLVFLVDPSTGAPAKPAARKSSNACTAIQVTAPDAPAQPKRKAKKKATFSASSILDLKLEGSLSPALKGQHQVEFKVYTPKGHLYQSLPATLSAPASSADRRARESAKRAAVATLPVAGTTIVTNSLYGEWRVEAFLDGDRETACARPVSFVIEP